MVNADIKVDAGRWGWMRTISVRIMRRLFAFLRISVYVVRGTRVVEDPHYVHKLAQIHFRELSHREILEAAKIPALKLGRDFVIEAIDRGDLAYGAFYKKELVSLIWRTLTEAPHIDGLSVRVNRPYSYAYKAFTLPSYRGKHLSPSLILYSDRELLKRKYTHRAGFVDVCNIASMEAGKYAGSRLLGFAGYAKWFGRIIPFSTPAVKKIGFEFFLKKNNLLE